MPVSPVTKLDLSRVQANSAGRAPPSATRSSGRKSLNGSNVSSIYDDDALHEVMLRQTQRDGKISLCNQPHRQDLADLYNLHHMQPHRVEFVYLRDCSFRSFAPFAMMGGLKVLDLSGNFLSQFDLLAPLPHLRQLFLDGNCLATLRGMPVFEDLQVLSLSRNQLTSLDGMPVLPCLLVLHITENPGIESLAGFPRHPMLESVSMDAPAVFVAQAESPAPKGPTFRQALIGISSSSLRRINARDISDDERREAHTLIDAKKAICLREGLQPADVHSAEAADRFLETIQREVNQMSPLDVLRISLTGTPTEGSTLSLDCVLALRPSVTQEETPTFLPSQLMPIDLSRYSSVKMTAPHAGLEIPTGTRFIYVTPGEYTLDTDGEILSVMVTAESLAEARHAMLSRNSNSSGGVGTKTGIFSLQWFRSTPNGEFCENMDTETSSSYVCELADVGNSVMIECTGILVSSEERRFSCIAVSERVAPGPPRCSHLQIVGTPQEGEPLTVSYSYSGGMEGLPQASVEWSVANRVVCSGSATFVPLLDHVGRPVHVSVLVKNSEGTVSPFGPVSAHTSTAVGSAPPSVKNLRFTGSFMEGETVAVAGDYYGGLEGASAVAWHEVVNESAAAVETMPESDSALSQQQPVLGEGRSLLLTKDHIGKLLFVSYKPVSTANDLGKLVTVVASQRVAAAVPEVYNLRLVGTCAENAVLEVQYDYRGGAEGESEISAPFGSARRYCPTFADVGSVIVVTVTPVRSDGLRGQPVTVSSATPIEAGTPTVTSLSIRGTIKQGETVAVDHVYTGGTEGASEIRWYRSMDDESWELLSEVAPNVREIIVSSMETDRALKVVYVPVRSDGVKGEPRELITEAVGAGDPLCDELEIFGDLNEGGAVSVRYLYWGGVGGAHEFVWETASGVVVGRGQSIVLPKEAILEKIRVTMTPVRRDGVRGEQKASELTSAAVEPSSPCVSNIAISGEYVEGKQLTLSYIYSGGHEGSSEIYWNGKRTDSRTQLLPLSWIGQAVEVAVVGVRQHDGMQSARVSFSSGETVRPGEPCLLNPHFAADLSCFVEGGEAVFIPTYFGGAEKDPQEKVVVPLSLDHVHKKVLITYKPVRSDGVEGAPVTVWSQTEVAPLPPVARNVRLAEGVSIREGEKLTVLYEYSGGFEGDSLIRWFVDGDQLVSEDCAPVFELGAAHVGKRIRVEVTPVRAISHAVGTPISYETAAVEAINPSVALVQIIGAPFVSSTLGVLATGYKGGFEGNSVVEFVLNDSTVLSTQKFTPSIEDLGKTVKARYTPIRAIDGKRGPTVESAPVVIGIDPDYLQFLQTHVQSGEATMRVVVEGEGELLFMVTPKKLLLGTEKKATVKEELSPAMTIDALNEMSAAVVFSAKKPLQRVLQFPTQRDRDYAVFMVRVVLALCEKGNAKGLLGDSVGKQVNKDMTGKDGAKRLAALQQAMPEISTGTSQKLAICLEAVKRASGGTNSEVMNRMLKSKTDGAAALAASANVAKPAPSPSGRLQVQRCKEEDKQAWRDRRKVFVPQAKAQ